MWYSTGDHRREVRVYNAGGCVSVRRLNRHLGSNADAEEFSLTLFADFQGRDFYIRIHSKAWCCLLLLVFWNFITWPPKLHSWNGFDKRHDSFTRVLITLIWVNNSFAMIDIELFTAPS